MTRKEAIENHRKMWNWIADETERRHRIVIKTEYFRINGLCPMIMNNCYCCQYALTSNGYGSYSVDCEKCPIKWGEDFLYRGELVRLYCFFEKSLFSKWSKMIDKALDIPGYEEKYWPEIAKLAREIANLPEWNPDQNIDS